jgi:polysaccharide pyruvyl transferase WcaK-like protein
MKNNKVVYEDRPTNPARMSSLAGWKQHLEGVISRWERQTKPAAVNLANSAGRLLIIPPSPPGSLGDQAYVEAAVLLARDRGWSPMLLLDEGTAAWEGQISDVPQYRLPLHESSRAVRAMENFLASMRPQDAIVALGADTACGAYGRDALLPLLYVGEAGWRGFRAGVINLGFDQIPDQMFMRIFSAFPSSVSLVLRDTDALSRARTRLDHPATLGADLAFLWRGPEPEVPSGLRHWVHRQRSEGRLLIVLNIHSLLAGVSPHADRESLSCEALLGDVAQVLAELVAEDKVSVVLTPHDRRGPLSDEALAARLRVRLPEWAAERVFDAGRITLGVSRWLVGQVDVAVSGRMHLAISCLVAGTPVICVTYQDKFSGVMRGAGVDRLMLTPGELRSPGVLRARLKEAAATSSTLRDAITPRVAISRRLAAENLNFLLADKP